MSSKQRCMRVMPLVVGVFIAGVVAASCPAQAATFTPTICAGSDFNGSCSLAELLGNTVADNGIVLNSWSSNLFNPHDIEVLFSIPGPNTGIEMTFTRYAGNQESSSAPEPLISATEDGQINYHAAPMLGHIITEAVLGATGATASGDGLLGIDKQMTAGSHDAFIHLGCNGTVTLCPTNGALGLGVSPLDSNFYGGFDVKDLLVASAGTGTAEFDVLEQSFFVPVPEPSSTIIFCLGVMGAAAARYRRRHDLPCPAKGKFLDGEESP
jgi:hypothetical protein